MKSGPLITQLFTVLDFVFDHLFRDFEKIINFRCLLNKIKKERYVVIIYFLINNKQLLIMI